jgi:hypothetical protein
MSKKHDARKPFLSSEFPSFPSLLPYYLGRQPRSIGKKEEIETIRTDTRWGCRL